MKLKIIAKLWSAVYDLLFYIDGKSNKSLDQIHNDLDVIEAMHPKRRTASPTH